MCQEAKEPRIAGEEGTRVKHPMAEKIQWNTLRRVGTEGRRPATRVCDLMTRAQPGLGVYIQPDNPDKPNPRLGWVGLASWIGLDSFFGTRTILQFSLLVLD